MEKALLFPSSTHHTRQSEPPDLATAIACLGIDTCSEQQLLGVAALCRSRHFGHLLPAQLAALVRWASMAPLSLLTGYSLSFCLAKDWGDAISPGILAEHHSELTESQNELNQMATIRSHNEEKISVDSRRKRCLTYQRTICGNIWPTR